MENGTYTGNFFGLWTPANGYRDGEETACNKTGDDIARLQLFAISKEHFHHDYITASSGLPAGESIDATPLIVNPQFTGNGFGWNMSGTWGNQRFNGAVEVWHSTNFDFSQTITGLPDGRYTVTCQMANGEGNNTGYLYATSVLDGFAVETKATVVQSCAGSNFDAQRDKMAANAAYGLLKVDIDVTGGSLTIGIKEPTSGTTWLVWDNMTLTCEGGHTTGIEPVQSQIENRKPSESKCFDLQGRRLYGSPAKGMYIRNGRKFLVR
jgi:hypothetical protein